MDEFDSNAIRKSLERLAAIPDEEWEFVVAHARSTTVRKKDHLFRVGDAVDYLYYIHSGLLRVYYEHDGAERTRSFAFENRFYTNSYSFLERTPSHYSVEALEDTLLSSLPYAIIQRAFDRHPCWERIGRLQANANFVAKEEKEMELRVYTPEQRYLRLIEQDSPILRRVPLYHVASYLGITPETLSRIRSRTSI